MFWKAMIEEGNAVVKGENGLTGDFGTDAGVGKGRRTAKGVGVGLESTSVEFGKAREVIRGRGMFEVRRGWLVGDTGGVERFGVFASGAKMIDGNDVVTVNKAGLFAGSDGDGGGM